MGIKAMQIFKIFLGLILAFGIGFFCRYSGVPVPAPPVLPGALLVLAMTVGFVIANRIAEYRLNSTKHLCGGPTGQLPSLDSHTKT